MNKKSPDINDLITFTKFTQKYQRVERKIFLSKVDRKENDLEHSGQLALVSWYILDRLGLKLNRESILKYCLAHDLVEVYAGDVGTFDDEARKDKEEREEEARLRIKSEFPEFRELHEIIKNYEKLADNESKFVYALDKLLPVLNIYLDDGRSWRIERVSLEMVREYKKDKVKNDSTIEDYFDQMIELLKKNEADLF